MELPIWYLTILTLLAPVGAIALGELIAKLARNAWSKAHREATKAPSSVVDFCAGTGLGMTIWKYAALDEATLQAVRKAAAEQSNRARVFIPVYPDEAAK